MLSYLPATGNYTLRVRSDGHSTDYGVDDTGDYYFSVNRRLFLEQSDTTSLQSAIRSGVRQIGSRAVTSFEVGSTDAGHEIDITVGQLSNFRMNLRVGIFVNATVSDSAELACRCVPHPVLNTTIGSTCAFHASTDLYPWCYVTNSSCHLSISTGDGAYYTNNCLPGMTYIAGAYTSSDLWRYANFPALHWATNYAVTVHEAQCPTCAFQYISDFTLGLSESSAIPPQHIPLNKRVYGRIDYVGDVDYYSVYGQQGEALVIKQFACCPSGYISTLDFDVLAPNGTMISGQGLLDQSQLLVSGLPEDGNYSIRVRSYGSATQSQVDDTGDYYFTVYRRSVFTQTASMQLQSSIRARIAQLGSRAVIGVDVSEDDVGGSVALVVGLLSQTQYDLRIGVYVNASAGNSSVLPCSCRQPSGTNSTFGSTCAFHRLSDQYPWCYVASTCSAALSAGGGLHYTQQCMPGMARITGATTSSDYYRNTAIMLNWNTNYAVTVEENQCSTCVFEYTTDLTIGFSESSLVMPIHVPLDRQVYGKIDYVGDVDYYSVYGATGDALVVRSHDCCPSNYIYLVDIDILAPNGTSIAGHGTSDNAQILVSGLPEDGNYTIIVRAYGHSTHSYVDDTGGYHFTVWRRQDLTQTDGIALASDLRGRVSQLGSRLVAGFDVEPEDVNGTVAVVIGRLSTSAFDPRIGVFVNASAVGAESLPCQCMSPPGLTGTYGAYCGYHDISDQYPWCYVDAACGLRSSAGIGLFKTTNCLPGMVWFAGASSTSSYYRLRNVRLGWDSNYAITVDETRCTTCQFQYTASFTLGISESTAVVSQYVPPGASIRGAIDYIGDIDMYSFDGAPGDVFTLEHHACCPGGFIYLLDFDVFAPNGSSIAGHGTQDHGRLIVPVLTEPGVYTVRIQSYGSATHSYVDDTGMYTFTIEKRLPVVPVMLSSTAPGAVGYGHALQGVNVLVDRGQIPDVGGSLCTADLRSSRSYTNVNWYGNTTATVGHIFSAQYSCITMPSPSFGPVLSATLPANGPFLVQHVPAYEGFANLRWLDREGVIAMAPHGLQRTHDFRFLATTSTIDIYMYINSHHSGGYYNFHVFTETGTSIYGTSIYSSQNNRMHSLAVGQIYRLRITSPVFTTTFFELRMDTRRVAYPRSCTVPRVVALQPASDTIASHEAITSRLSTTECPFQLFTFAAVEGDVVSVNVHYATSQTNGRAVISDIISRRFRKEISNGEYGVNFHVPYSGAYSINVSTRIPVNCSFSLQIQKYDRADETVELIKNVWYGVSLPGAGSMVFKRFIYDNTTSITFDSMVTITSMDVEISDAMDNLVLSRRFSGDLTLSLAQIASFVSGHTYVLRLSCKSNTWVGLRIKHTSVFPYLPEQWSSFLSPPISYVAPYNYHPETFASVNSIVSYYEYNPTIREATPDGELTTTTQPGAQSDVYYHADSNPRVVSSDTSSDLDMTTAMVHTIEPHTTLEVSFTNTSKHGATVRFAGFQPRAGDTLFVSFTLLQGAGMTVYAPGPYMSHVQIVSSADTHTVAAVRVHSSAVPYIYVLGTIGNRYALSFSSAYDERETKNAVLAASPARSIGVANERSVLQVPSSIWAVSLACRDNTSAWSVRVISTQFVPWIATTDFTSGLCD